MIRCKLHGKGNSSAVLGWRKASLFFRPTVPCATKGLYDSSDGRPLQAGYLRVDGGLHDLYYEVHGHEDGAPAVVVHGGPGAGSYLNHTRFFDLNLYKVVLLDQRACGRSTPRGRLVGNNTNALVSDLDALRQHLSIDRWLLFGGSWGVALSLAYALTHPHRVTAMILRGVCAMRQQEIDWMYGGGAGALKPWAWQRFLDHLDPEERKFPLMGYYRRLLSKDVCVRDAAAQSWLEWEMSVGFASNSQLLDWDGGQWSYQTFPTPLTSRSPPRPARPSPASSPAPHKPILHEQANIHSTPRSVRGVSELKKQTPWFTAGKPAHLPGEHMAALLQEGLSFRGDPSMPSTTAQAMLECHYSVHGGFLRGRGASVAPQDPQMNSAKAARAKNIPVAAASDGSLTLGGSGHELPLLERVHNLSHIPAIAVQGQMDLVCPAITAFDLHNAWPELQLRFVPGAGHSMYDPAITHELVEATALMYDVMRNARDNVNAR
ncbi:hypothetical protein VOLCADRAFT_105760 [Volvox carteri f. nagariensis]|uniref:prolyl aminopeptidase n=1 Tax=Volvox carteri f. nagariensis TaxID=3068 RepID=D8U2W3_VOLCA|nr:uncharacterized protein VOLCADRAFT_105760 [Volvox carteri f. nagariensis]EFJ45968.1 hypothetical protein VOLCADRAFT_105760 [Volvox carteri f. nagariensis]|eukprot:XP_002953046.1 hypothetical protein VOLCADRAFT_105760 [Volvox carteri f. nagariensis]